MIDKAVLAVLQAEIRQELETNGRSRRWSILLGEKCTALRQNAMELELTKKGWKT